MLGVPEELIEISSDELRAVIRPEKGADILSIRVQADGTELLWQAPWGPRHLGAHTSAESSLDHWVARNGGGWNVLIPNAGPPREGHGVTWGFHGEAAVIAWDVKSRSPRSVTLATSLFTAPLDLVRVVTLEGDTLQIDETVVNRSPDPTHFRWGHHPTFGQPLVEAGARIELAARQTVVAAASGFHGARSGSAGSWPVVAGDDLSVVGADRSLLAYLTGLDSGRVRLINERRGLSVELVWPVELFPWLWVWEELDHTSGHPWFRSTRALALEPHSGTPDGSDGIVLDGGGRLAASFALRATTGR